MGIGTLGSSSGPVVDGWAGVKERKTLVESQNGVHKMINELVCGNRCGMLSINGSHIGQDPLSGGVERLIG